MKRPEKLGRYNGGLQEFIVPNSHEGDVFLLLMRRFLNRHKYTLRVWGRGSRKGVYSSAPQTYCPLDQAGYYVVYIHPKGGKVHGKDNR
jgi:hypothetical protein